MWSTVNSLQLTNDYVLKGDFVHLNSIFPFLSAEETGVSEWIGEPKKSVMLWISLFPSQVPALFTPSITSSLHVPCPAHAAQQLRPSCSQAHQPGSMWHPVPVMAFNMTSLCLPPLLSCWFLWNLQKSDHPQDFYPLLNSRKINYGFKSYWKWRAEQMDRQMEWLLMLLPKETG